VAEVSVAERLTAAGFSLGWGTGRAFDTRLARALFDEVADLGWRRRGPGVEQLRTNLRRVVGPDMSEAHLDDLTRRGVRSYARYFREMFWMPTARAGLVAQRTNTYGDAHVERVLAQGRGVILALPHSGNWDAAAVGYMARFDRPMTVVAERLRPESLYQRFAAYREGLGMVVVPLTGGARPSAPQLSATLRAGGTVSLVCDRDLSSSGVPVSFFGQTIRVPPGPAMLAIRTGAAIIPTLPGFAGDDWNLELFPEVDVDTPDSPKRLRERVIDVMQRVVDRFAISIARVPQDWHMVQRLWVEDLESSPTRTSPK